MKALIVPMILISSIAMGETNTSGTDNNVNVCKPHITVKSCGSCERAPKVITKVVEKPTVVEKIVTVEKQVEVVVEKETIKRVKNNVSLLVGYGAKGNLKESQNEVIAENGPVFGAQYLRNFDSGLNGLIQIQTNRTISVGVGVGF